MRRSFLTARSSVWSHEANMGSLQLPYVFGLHGNIWTSEVWNKVHHDRVRLQYFTVMHQWRFNSCFTCLRVIFPNQDFCFQLYASKKTLKHIWVYISRPHPASSGLHNGKKSIFKFWSSTRFNLQFLLRKYEHSHHTSRNQFKLNWSKTLTLTKGS